jgi:membrane protein
MWDLLKHYFGGLYDRIDRHHIFLFAGGLAFSMFICIIPFVLIMFWMFGNFLNSAELEIHINVFIDKMIPYQTYADFVKSIITKRISEAVQYKNIAGIIGFVGLFFAASGFFSSLRTILNKVFGQERDLNLFIGLIRDFGIILVSIFIFLFLTILVPLLDVLRLASGRIDFLKFLQYGVFQKAITTTISISVLTVIFAVIYHYIPIKKIRKRSVVVGALWAAFLWEIAKSLFGLYIYNFPTLNNIYGTYVLMIVVVFWIYYSSLIFIIGAEIGELFNQRLVAKIERKHHHFEI